MTMLDPKGLEAAREQPGTNHEAIIRAYIDAIMPVRVSGLVERLRQYEDRSWETTYCYNGVRDEAGTSIENLSIGLATVWRGKLEAEDALASERAAHAETKRERDEAKTKSNYWQAEYLNACRDASSFADDLVSAEAQRDESLKALDRLLVPFEGDECRKDHHGYCQTHFLEEDCCVAAARRALGGKADG